MTGGTHVSHVIIVISLTTHPRGGQSVVSIIAKSNYSQWIFPTLQNVSKKHVSPTNSYSSHIPSFFSQSQDDEKRLFLVPTGDIFPQLWLRSLHTLPRPLLDVFSSSSSSFALTRFPSSLRSTAPVVHMTLNSIPASNSRYGYPFIQS